MNGIFFSYPVKVFFLRVLCGKIFFVAAMLRCALCGKFKECITTRRVIMKINTLAAKIVWILLALFAIALIIGCGSSDKSKGDEQSYEPLPKFELIGFDGNEYTNKPFAKGVGIISFVASWCGPCCTELLELDSLAKTYNEISALAVTYEPPEFYKAILDSIKVKIPIAMADSGFFKKLGINAFPTRILVQKGKIIARTVGAPKPADSKFSRCLLKALGIEDSIETEKAKDSR